jgi:hypothetical protein
MTMHQVSSQRVLDAAKSDKRVKDLTNGDLVRVAGHVYKVTITGTPKVRIRFSALELKVRPCS